MTASDEHASDHGTNDDWLDEWFESLDYILKHQGPDHASALLARLSERAHARGVHLTYQTQTPYVNTIPLDHQPPYPGDREIEHRIKSCIRWNAMAMVVRANRESPGIGGHISTYASCATLYEVGFNHFFHARTADHPGDQVYFQGHAAPGVYARAFLEGRLTDEQIEHFRRELDDPPGIPSYPHPRLLPGFWQFPTVSMGLAPILGIYQARFNRYLSDRGLLDTARSKVWVFLGDGETDEPESLGALTLASREKLDNLIFVVNCNLQRLDGPVRGNGKIIQELEAAFRGAGWNVIKVIWSGDFDPLLAADDQGLLVRRMGEVVDGQYQKYVVEPGAYVRKDFFGVHPELAKLVEHLSDDQLRRLRRGGHDPEKVYAAFHAAVRHQGSPTVILVKTIKGYGLGEAGEGKNITHQQKKLNEEELREFRSRFSIPLSDAELAGAPFYKPPEGSPEMRYLRERRQTLGGYLPARVTVAPPIDLPSDDVYREFFEGTAGRDASTTMAFVRLLTKLLRDPALGKWLVPIVPDEARTFGMEPLFRQCGIYSSAGQLYSPVDSDQLLYYREARDGQILEEGVTEAGAMASFAAAGTSYATHGARTIPFFLFYSMFGFQRVGDLIWAAADMRARGFLLGGTSGRTTLAGEGLQHQDGHSHLLAASVPSVRAYDPAFAYEIAAIVRDGLRRIGREDEDIVYYITLGNEPYPMPPLPKGAEEGILRGLYRYLPDEGDAAWPRVQLVGSGSILREAVRARDLLRDRFQVAAAVWSATSYGELRRDALAVDRWNARHPGESPRIPYVFACLASTPGPVIAASDYVRAVPELAARWLPGRFHALGTDGFGRSDARPSLRRYFEVDAENIAARALYALSLDGRFDARRAAQAMGELGLDPDRPDPWAL